MSHFAILVVGDNVEKQMAKFSENLEVPRYVLYTKEQLIEKGKKRIADYKKNYLDEYLADPIKYDADCNNKSHITYVSIEFPKKLEWTDEQIYAEEIEGYDAEDIGPNGEVYSTRNPDSKWDWWTIGGRYRDRLLLTANGTGEKGTSMDKYPDMYSQSKKGYVDSALKGDIAWDSMHLNKNKYDEALREWELIVEGADPQNKLEKETKENCFYRPEYFLDRYKTKEVYAQSRSSFTMWGILKDGVWYEKGGMGWFGMSDESDEDAVKFELGFYDNFIKDLPNDVLLTVVDCHI